MTPTYAPIFKDEKGNIILRLLIGLIGGKEGLYSKSYIHDYDVANKICMVSFYNICLGIRYSM